MAPFVEIVKHILIAIKIWVGAKHCQIIGGAVGTVGFYCTVVELGKLIGVEEFGKIGGFLHIELSTEIYLCPSIGFAALGLYKDYAVGRTHTVDGCRSGILKHGDTLDIVGVKV